jgi:CRP-like cAMP-binding protein
MSFPPNQVLFHEGSTSTEMYILLAGKVEILKNNKRIAFVEENGSYLGELSTLLGVPRTATVRTLSPCECVVVSGDKVQDFFNGSPALALKLARILADRLAKMNVGYVQLERRVEQITEKLNVAQDRLKRREQQMQQLVERIERGDKR